MLDHSHMGSLPFGRGSSFDPVAITLSHIGEVRLASVSLAEWFKGDMPISGDPVPMVMGLHEVFQVLRWPGDVRFTKGKIVILGYFFHVVVPPTVVLSTGPF